MRTLLERGGRLGGLGGVVELLQSSAPSTIQSQRDAKAALDRELRAHCETFIRHCTDAAAKPITQLLATVSPPTAAEAAAGDGGTGSGAGPAAATALTAAGVAAAVAAAEEGVNGEVARAHALMAAYLPEPSTQSILFSPIRESIIDALGQLQTLMNAVELTAPQRAGFEPERLARLAAAIDAMAGKRV